MFCFITMKKYFYRPQRSCGQGNIFTPVCHSVHRGGLPQCMLGYPPGSDSTPPDQADTPQTRHPPDQADPPWTRHHHPPDKADGPSRSRLQHAVYERPVSILLECILVLQMFILSHYNATVNQYKHLVNFIFFGLDFLPTLVEKGVIL